MAENLMDALKSGNFGAVRAAVKADPKAARHPRAIVMAAGKAFLPAMK